MGPRLIRDLYGPQLEAWQALYSNREGKHTASLVWATRRLRETRYIVSLTFVSGAHVVTSVARWAINFPLDRPLTPAETKVANGPRGVVALDSEAERLSRFPPARWFGKTSEIELAAAALQPYGHTGLIVSLFPAYAISPELVTRRGVDVALLAGEELIRGKRVPPGSWQRISRRVVVAVESMNSDGQAGAPRSWSREQLFKYVTAHPTATVLLQWPTPKDLRLAGLIARPVPDVLVILNSP